MERSATLSDRKGCKPCVNWPSKEEADTREM